MSIVVTCILTISPVQSTTYGDRSAVLLTPPAKVGKLGFVSFGPFSRWNGLTVVPGRSAPPIGRNPMILNQLAATVGAEFGAETVNQSSCLVRQSLSGNSNARRVSAI